jgi:aryl-alcohol dehydrogenase-like predicted oxidoreductase
MKEIAKNKIVLGTVQFGLNYGINNQIGKPTEDKIFEILDEAFNKCIKKLDTADVYGNAVDIIGEYHQKRQNRFEVITKFKNDNLKEQSINEWVYSQLDRLKCENLYGCMFHSFDDYKQTPELINELIALKQKGIINKIGVSIYSNEQFEEVLNDESIKLVQLPYNLLDNENLRGELINNAKKKNVEVHTRSVFLQGLFFMNLDNLPERLIPLKPYLSKLHELSKKYHLSLHELALNYAISNQNIDNVLIGVESLAQLKSNLETSNKTIPDQLLREINNINVKRVELLNPSNWR